MTTADNHTGWKAVWMSSIDNEDDFETYTDDSWNEHGERIMSLFATDFHIDWYDFDQREFHTCLPTENIEAAILDVSHADKFIWALMIDLAKLETKEFKSFMIITDFRYEGNVMKSRNTSFMGNYRYK